MKLNGNAICYGDNVDTDVIIPARYLNTSDPAELAKHCMEDIDKEFLNKFSRAISSPRWSAQWYQASWKHARRRSCRCCYCG